MSTFKDQLISDLDIFINLDEFGELHSINGRDIAIIIDNDRLDKRSNKEYDGISVGELLFFVKMSDYGSCPEKGTPVIFDGRQMYVFDTPREDMGMYEIILKQNRGV